MEIVDAIVLLYLGFGVLVLHQLMVNVPALRDDYNNSSWLIRISIVMGVFILWWAVVIDEGEE